MADPLLGLETEYAIAFGRREDATAIGQERVVHQLLQIAEKRLEHLRDAHALGMYLGNGSRLYLDAGNHVELSTPECSDPWQVVRYTLAGERVLAGLLDEAAVALGMPAESPPGLLKCNVDYSGSHTTVGCHESYLHRASHARVVESVVPHLVSRICFTGAGGFNSRSRGLEFVLSPRSAHLTTVVSDSSTESRGIVHTKDESLGAPGQHRLHILCGESLCSELGQVLKLGTTTLVVSMIEGGVLGPDTVALQRPLHAMRRIAADATCKRPVPLRDGRRLTAVEIQRSLLDLAASAAGRPFMPSWTGDLCEAWSAALDLLAEGAPDSVADRFDWAIKHALYRAHAARRGVRWESLPAWSWVMRRLPTRLQECESGLRDRLASYLRRRGLAWNDLERVEKLRWELFELDARFAQVGEQGLFAGIDRRGLLRHAVDRVGDVVAAMTEPPASGRAHLRGSRIRELAPTHGRYTCTWNAIVDREDSRMLDLRDPYASEAAWIHLRSELDLLERDPLAIRARLRERLARRRTAG